MPQYLYHQGRSRSGATLKVFRRRHHSGRHCFQALFTLHANTAGASLGACKSASPACYVLSRQGLTVAARLGKALAQMSEQALHPPTLAPLHYCAPTRLAQTPEALALPGGICAFQSLKEFLAHEYSRRPAHIFVGAAGIAVRALAPLLRHKSHDAPVLVIDPAGTYVISLLSGHWGGGNELARHLAQILGAQAVITTASDNQTSHSTQAEHTNLPDQSGHNPPLQAASPLALDLAIRNAGLRILDWQALPHFQAALLEARPVRYYDPCHALPAALTQILTDASVDQNQMSPVSSANSANSANRANRANSAGSLPPYLPPANNELLLAAHWRRIKPAPGLLRLAVPVLYIGLGCRRDVPPRLVREALEDFFMQHGLEGAAIAGLATVSEKLTEPALRALANTLRLPLYGFSAQDLARQHTPNPSTAAGLRFNCAPFSVCEAAALMAAEGATGPGARLLIPKHAAQGKLTIAVALAAQTKKYS